MNKSTKTKVKDNALKLASRLPLQALLALLSFHQKAISNQTQFNQLMKLALTTLPVGDAFETFQALQHQYCRLTANDSEAKRDTLIWLKCVKASLVEESRSRLKLDILHWLSILKRFVKPQQISLRTNVSTWGEFATLLARQRRALKVAKCHKIVIHSLEMQLLNINAALGRDNTPYIRAHYENYINGRDDTYLSLPKRFQFSSRKVKDCDVVYQQKLRSAKRYTKLLRKRLPAIKFVKEAKKDNIDKKTKVRRRQSVGSIPKEAQVTSWALSRLPPIVHGQAVQAKRKVVDPQHRRPGLF